jgi:hypothetical protein
MREVLIPDAKKTPIRLQTIMEVQKTDGAVVLSVLYP